jgi:hypothetical protein
MPASVTSPSLHALRALLLFVLFILVPPFLAASAEERGLSSPPRWHKLITLHHDRLAKVESDQAALDLFVAAIGRAAEVNDVAATIAAKGLSPHVTKELMVPEITKSAQRLVAALVAWDVADRMMRAVEEKIAPADVFTTPSQAAWLTANAPFASLHEAVSQWDSGNATAGVGVAAGLLAQDAAQQAMEEWWRLKTWKDRVRTARGQARLCGTWQWVVHNHQRHHEERKLSLVFPPPGTEGTTIPGLTETVVLGDAVYLRWETDGRIQEDSLLFSKEGQRLEGSFVNSQGGWGSITGKRTATCTP